MAYFKARAFAKLTFAKNSGIVSRDREGLFVSRNRTAGRTKTAKRLCVSNVTGLLLACYVLIFTSHNLMFSGLLQKDRFKGK